jgi:hypothetical protein
MDGLHSLTRVFHLKYTLISHWYEAVAEIVKHHATRFGQIQLRASENSKMLPKTSINYTSRELCPLYSFYLTMLSQLIKLRAVERQYV